MILNKLVYFAEKDDEVKKWLSGIITESAI